MPIFKKLLHEDAVDSHEFLYNTENNYVDNCKLQRLMRKKGRHYGANITVHTNT